MKFVEKEGERKKCYHKNGDISELHENPGDPADGGAVTVGNYFFIKRKEEK